MQHFKTDSRQVTQPRQSQDWKVIRNLLPYLTAYKARIVFTLLCLIVAKAANLGVPILLKKIIDAMSIHTVPQALLVVPVS